MSPASDAEEQELLESIRRDLRESVAFWSPQNKVKRELYTVCKLLEHLGVVHDENEVKSAVSEPPDIDFRDAHFEIKEMMDDGRRRHDEYRKKLEKAEKATSLQELSEQYTPKDLTFEEIARRVVQILEDQSKHYAQSVIKQLDLLVYANLLEHIVVMDSPVPGSAVFSPFGWRSISIVRGSVACVLYARADAPEFLRMCVGKPLAQITVE